MKASNFKSVECIIINYPVLLAVYIVRCGVAVANNKNEIDAMMILLTTERTGTSVQGQMHVHEKVQVLTSQQSTVLAKTI